jgi:hypothetical protein
MSAPIVDTVLTNVDPNQANPQDLQGLVDILNTLLQSSIEGTFVPYVLSSSTPSVSDQDKSWLRVDGAGRPLGVYLFYNGNWRRFYNGNPTELRMFSGDPALYFDGTGLGLIVPTNGDLNTWDGWAICNGQNGTYNWSNLFPVVGQVDNVTVTGYSATAKDHLNSDAVIAAWQTNVTGTAYATGGAANYSIQNTDLPSMKVFLHGLADFNTNNTPAGEFLPLVTRKGDGGNKTTDSPQASFGADPTGTPAIPQTLVPTAPNFKAVCLTQWVGYA